MKAPLRIETARLVLERPAADDAAEILSRYAGDERVTRYVGWPRHTSMADSQGFVAFSDGEWAEWPAGPYLIRVRDGRALVGSTGLAFETPSRAMTGYVIAHEAWGRGYATEALEAIVALAPDLGIQRLYAICHAGHAASARVLEKCGFLREALLRRHTVFPNHAPGVPADVLSYARIF